MLEKGADVVIVEDNSYFEHKGWEVFIARFHNLPMYHLSVPICSLSAWFFLISSKFEDL